MIASVRERLAAGPPRGHGPSDAIAAEVINDQLETKELIEALSDERSWVMARAANALQKVQAARSELVAPFSKQILQVASKCEELHARWSLTIIVGELPLKGTQRALAIDLMFEALRSESALLRTFAMQGLVNFSVGDEALRRHVRPIVEEFAANGTAAMRARARKLLKEFDL